VERIVHVSALGVGSQAPSNYLRSKTEGERVLMDSGLDVTALRPSVIFGARDRFTNLFAALAAVAPFVPLAGANAQFQPVWVEDVAAAIVHCIDDAGTAGKVYECAGPQVYTLAEIVRLCARTAGHERTVLALPDWAARLQAAVLERLPGDPLLSRDNLDSMRVPNAASGKLPGLRTLGIEPAAIEGVAAGYLGHRAGVARLDRLRAAR
jgi:NADH dehydrogenase